VCVRSGEPADRLYEYTVDHLPGWVYAMAPIGIPFALLCRALVGRIVDVSIPGVVWLAPLVLPLALGWYLTATKVVGWLPLAETTQGALVRQRRQRTAAQIASLTLIVITVVASASWGWLAVLFGLVAVVALGAFASLSWELGLMDVGVDLGPGSHRVTLRNVHPDFAAAVHATFGPVRAPRSGPPPRRRALGLG
jgi:hypothetical protein